MLIQHSGWFSGSQERKNRNFPEAKYDLSPLRRSKVSVKSCIETPSKKQRQRQQQRKHHPEVNSRCFKLHRSYSNSFNLTNVGDYIRSWILKNCIQVYRKKRKSLSTSTSTSQLQLYSFNFNLQLHDSFHPRIGEPNRGGGRDTNLKKEKKKRTILQTVPAVAK